MRERAAPASLATNAGIRTSVQAPIETEAPAPSGRYRFQHTRILVIAAHPDDDVIGCGGLLSHVARGGGSVLAIYLTDGGRSHVGSRTFDSKAIVALREREAIDALTALGIRKAPMFFRLPDSALGDLTTTARAETIDLLARTIAEYGPDLVLAPWRRDPHSDHIAAYALTRESMRCAAYEGDFASYEVWLPIRGSVADRPKPGEVSTLAVEVDAIGTVEKRRAILAHASQTSDLIADDPSAFRATPEMIETWTQPIEYLHFEDRRSRLERSPFDRQALARAKYDRRGIFLQGRVAEMEALREMGARDASLGRLYEGHFNGALLVALYGTPEQRQRAHDDVDAGHLFGVWNTQDDEPVRIEAFGEKKFRLFGSKTWASGADTVSRAAITARGPDGLALCIVPLDRISVAVDPSAWRPLGMENSKSYRVDFGGVVLEASDVVGLPGDYERPPWFLAGALRFVAVQTGAVERLTSEVLRYLVARGRAEDPYQIGRAAEMRIAARSSWQWVVSANAAWMAYDDDPSQVNAERVLDAVDMARIAVERAALDVLERATRSVGAHGLVEPLPFARLIRDLQMYLRQPAPDGVLARIGTRGLSTNA